MPEKICNQSIPTKLRTQTGSTNYLIGPANNLSSLLQRSTARPRSVLGSLGEELLVNTLLLCHELACDLLGQITATLQVQEALALCDFLLPVVLGHAVQLVPLNVLQTLQIDAALLWQVTNGRLVDNVLVITFTASQDPVNDTDVLAKTWP